jgi:hypothetical protein
MGVALEKRLAKLEAKVEGDQIPIFCEEEREVPATVDRMIAAGALTEADRALCVYWLNCTGPNAPSEADLRSLLEQCEAGEERPKVVRAPEPGNAD